MKEICLKYFSNEDDHYAVFMIVYLLFLKYYRLTSKGKASLIMANSS